MQERHAVFPGTVQPHSVNVLTPAVPHHHLPLWWSCCHCQYEALTVLVIAAVAQQWPTPCKDYDSFDGFWAQYQSAPGSLAISADMWHYSHHVPMLGSPTDDSRVRCMGQLAPDLHATPSFDTGEIRDYSTGECLLERITNFFTTVFCLIM